MRVLPPMTENQQKLYCALALLEESDLKNFFRAIRDLPDQSPEVEMVNVELDHGVGLMDIFGPLGPLADHMAGNCMELEVLHLSNGRWSITFGFRGPSGYGIDHTMDISQAGEISNISGGICWVPRT